MCGERHDDHLKALKRAVNPLKTAEYPQNSEQPSDPQRRKGRQKK